MNLIILISILSVIVIGIISFLLFKSRAEVAALNTKYVSIEAAVVALNAKYGSIENVEEERARIQEEIESLAIERNRVKAVFIDLKKRLTSEYDDAHKLFEKLHKEINLLEESVEMIEFGVYKPHFDFDAPEEFRRQLELLREKEKDMIRSDRAVVCATEWSVQGSKTEGKKMTKQTHKLMLRAFNGECDAALAKVRWDNVLKMEERIHKAFEMINKSGEVNRSRITEEYLDLKIKELRLTFEHQEKIKQAKDEQRKIREEMRDEERAQREIERAKEEAEKEETHYSTALEKAREEIQKASGDKLDHLNDKISQLEAQLKAAQELKERAISRAQITKSGHVYIISNIGSFGENIYKIGMTRRFDPVERIDELSDASVPYDFDIHAMVYADNAPELENKLHKQFEPNRMNLVNPRREFFSVSLDEIEQWAKNENVTLQLTKIAEAREYRESMAIRAKEKEPVKMAVIPDIPKSIDGLFSGDKDTLDD
jgi:hypothetical protein